MRIVPLSCAALLTLVLTAPLAIAEPTPTPLAPEAPLAINVTELLPRSPQPQDAVELRGVLRNVGTTTVTDIRVRLRVGSPVRTRGGLHDADNERPLTQNRPATSTPPASASLAPGATTNFTIRTTVRALGLSQLGVYPLDVEARGNAGQRIETLGLAPTWMPFFAGLRVQPTRVAVVWPLVDRPHQSSLGTFVDAELKAALSNKGRLGRLLAVADAAATPQCERVLTPPAGAPPPQRCEPVLVTLAVDPDLLLAAQVMTGQHKLRQDDKTVSQDPVPAARTWLADMSRVAARNGLIALPYGDPDVTALTRGSDARLRDDLSLAAVLSRNAVAETLNVPVVQNVAWPPAGVVTAATADVLSRNGARALVLDPAAFNQPENEPGRAPSARTPLPSAAGVELQGLVADPFLSELISGNLAKQVGARLAEQRFLAETAIVAAEAPSLSRTLVIAPERRGDANVAAAVGALRDLGRVPWLCPVTLTSVAADSERCADRPTAATPAAEDRGQLRTARDGELSADYLERVAAQRTRAVQLAEAVLADKADPAVTAMRAGLRRAVARSESSAWRDDPTAAYAALALLSKELDDLTGKVNVRGGRVLLTSKSGEIQVRVENTLEVPISVRVRFSSRTLGLLTAQSDLVDVAPKNSVSVSVVANAQRSGQFFVDAHLVDRNGDDFGTATVVNGRSTRYGRLALALTVGATGVLLLAAAFRLIRRARHRTT